MDFDLSETECALRDRAREFAEVEVAPRAADADASGALDPALIAALGREGYMGLLVPSEYGGSGAGMLATAVVLEELARACASTATLVALQNAAVATVILHAGSEEQKRAWLPALARGEALGAFASSEPEVGSAVDAVTLEAEKDGDDYVLSGTKVFVAFGDEAHFYVVLGRTAAGMTAFLVTRAPGVAIAERVRTMGMRATGLATITLDRVRVPAANLLGAEGAGLTAIQGAIDDGRIAVAALALGIAEVCRRAEIERARTRTQFGQVIGRFQAVQWLIADMATDIDAARLLTWQAAVIRDGRGTADDDLAEAAALAKLAASETAVRAASRAMEIFGTWGYLAGSPVERAYRDAKATELLQGTTEIAKLAIARRLLEARA